MLIQLKGGVGEALCAEPAIRKYGIEQAGNIKLTICCENADLYVGHPVVEGIMYQSPETEGPFNRVVVLEPIGESADSKMRGYAEQLDVTMSGHPEVYLTSLDLIRTDRFGLSKLKKTLIAIILSNRNNDTAKWNNLARILSERFGACVAFLSFSKHSGLEFGFDLTGRLMPREMAAVLSKTRCWIAEETDGALLGIAVKTAGILLTDEALFEERPLVEQLSARCTEDEIVQSVCGMIQDRQ